MNLITAEFFSSVPDQHVKRLVVAGMRSTTNGAVSERTLVEVQNLDDITCGVSVQWFRWSLTTSERTTTLNVDPGEGQTFC